MPDLRLACYNIAWFSRLFDQRNRLVDDLEWSELYNVTRRRQAEAIAGVLRRVDADCFAIIEAPNSGRRQSCVAQLTDFAEHFDLRQRAALIGFANSTHQEIALLFDPTRISAEPVYQSRDVLEHGPDVTAGALRRVPWKHRVDVAAEQNLHCFRTRRFLCSYNSRYYNIQ